MPRGVGDLDRDRVIIEPAKVILCVALDIRGIRGGPVAPVARVTEQVKCRSAKRVAAFLGREHAVSVVDAVLLIGRTRLARDAEIARRERQTTPIEHGATWDRAE